jgi:hypothetical protein
MKDERLTLLAQSAADLPALSALLQDATVRMADIGFDRRGKRLALLINRYRWEAKTPSRVRSALRLETVSAVQRQGWPGDSEAVLPLLALRHDGDFVVLSFGGGAALRARVEVLEIVLEDLSPPLRARRTPEHP